MTQQEADQLIDKYFKGRITPAEMQRLNVWLDDHDDTQAHVPEREAVIKERIALSLRNKIAAHTNGRVRVLRPRTVWLRVAASLAVAVVAGYALFMNRVALHDWVDPVVYRQQQTPGGLPRKVMLADGSVVWLNAQSTLRYPEKFNRDTREVFIDGEAFFDVQKDPGKPFLVHAGGVDVRVLGTSFNVQNYAGEEDIAVTLATGKVTVNRPGAEASPMGYLVPHQQFVYHKADSATAIREVRTETFTSWKEGRLQFVDTPLERIARALQRRYDIDIAFSDERLKQCRITVTFDHKDALQAIRLLSMLANATYKIDGRRVVLAGAACVKDPPD